MTRFPVKVLAVAALVAAPIVSGTARVAAALPAAPAPCSWSFGAVSTQGALGTLVEEVNLVPASPGMSCLQTVPMTAQITDAAGHVPAGISPDGGTAPVDLLFSAGEYPPPAVSVAWHAHCTTVPQPVFLHLSGQGMAASYALGQSVPCSQGPASTSVVDPPFVFSPSPAVGLAPAPGGYRIAGATGVVVRQPGAAVAGVAFSAAPVTGIANSPAGGFWLASSTGGVFTSDGSHFYGSAFGAALHAPIVGIAATPTGHGYWLVGADGGVFTFGDAHFYGSTGAIHLGAAIVGIAATSDGHGYWLAGADGGVFTFGDAHFHGSAGSVMLAAPVTAIAGNRATGGYWLAAADGGVFAYGAPFHGSAAGSHLSAPITAITSTSDSGGYWLLGADGGVFTYGNATYHGTGTPVVEP